MLRAVLLPTFCWAALARGRQVWSLDEAWRFALEESRPRSCAAGTFPRSLPGRCPHLAKQGRPEDGGPGSAAACRAACCEDVSCNAWQWCGPNATCEAPNSCWKGLVDLANCSTAGQWQGEGDPSMRPKRPKVGQPCDHEQCQVHFNDSHWELLDVPHDFVVAGNFSPHADKSHGYLPYKVGWYRKRLCLNVEEMQAENRQGWLEFEGVMVRSQVWLNGEFLGDHFSGYTPRLLDISQVTLKSGCENLLAVRADATSPDGWWYDGGGIYRHVWLTSVAPVHIAPFGLYTPAVVVGKIDRTEGLEYADAEVRPTVELVNQHNTSRNVHVECSISDGGKFVTSKDFDTSLAAGASLDLALPHMPLPGAKLWSPRNPALYVMTVRIWGSDHSPGALPDDEVRVTFGVRQLSWSADTGFSINGVATKILGTANHQDVAVLGVAVPDHLQAYRLEMLQKVGANAWRTAHNPPNVALLDAADRLGVMVWDENHRNGQDSEMEVMVRRDRNHPSIIIWSVCNENLCHSDHVVDDARRLQDLAHRLDPLMGRLVSANYNEFNGNKTPMDLMGFDYGPEMYDRWHAEAPWKPSISSETSSAYSDRGLVQNDPKTGHVRDYDTEHPSWGQTAQVAWQAILRRPFVAGGFTWTGWDYRGEPTPYAWPDVSSHFGILDMAGFWKHRAHWYHACWTSASPPALHLLPHWNWAENQTVEVWAYSNVEEVELIHPNGSSMGRRFPVAGNCSHFEWPEVRFQAGSLRARGYVNGQVVAMTSVSTTGPASALSVAFKDGLGAVPKSKEVALISIEVVDQHGNLVPTASNVIAVTGLAGATVLGTCSGDPADQVPNASPWRNAFGGRLLAVARAAPGARLAVTSPGLPTAELQWPSTLVV